MTLMVGSPVIVSVAEGLIRNAGALSRSGSAALSLVAFGLVALLMPVVLVLLVTGPVFSGRDGSAVWPASTKGLAVAWTAVVTALSVWKIYTVATAT